MLRASLECLRLFGKRLASCLSWSELLISMFSHLLPGLDLNQWPTLLDGGALSASAKFNKDPNCRPALQRLTESGEEDLLQSILEKLPPANLLQAARVRPHANPSSPPPPLSPFPSFFSVYAQCTHFSYPNAPHLSPQLCLHSLNGGDRYNSKFREGFDSFTEQPPFNQRDHLTIDYTLLISDRYIWCAGM